MYPTLTVIAGYLAADILLGGYTAALAVFSLGLGEFLFLKFFRNKKHPALILEGSVLAAAGLAGEKLASLGYSGSGYVIIELVLAGALLISTAMGRPWLASQMKRFSGFSAGREFLTQMSVLMGLLFLVHGGFLVVLIALTGSVPVMPAILSFAVLYSLEILYMRKKQKTLIAKNAPVLLEGGEGEVVLELSGEKLGRMMMQPGAVTVVGRVEIMEDHEVHEFLEALEKYLKQRGCKALRFTEWETDELPLEISGYSRTPAGWNKIL